MSNELSVAGEMKLVKDGVTIKLGHSGRVTVSGTKITELIQNVGTSEEALQLGDISSLGWVLIENLDATNYVEIRPAQTLADLIQIPAGLGAGPFRFAAAVTAPFVIANTAACDIRILLIEQ